MSEIVFEKDANIDVNQKFKKISESIEEIGFKNTANLYSIADSTKFGGDIGWIEANSLSGVISELLNKSVKLKSFQEFFLILTTL